MVDPKILSRAELLEKHNRAWTFAKQFAGWRPGEVIRENSPSAANRHRFDLFWYAFRAVAGHTNTIFEDCRCSSDCI